MRIVLRTVPAVPGRAVPVSAQGFSHSDSDSPPRKHNWRPIISTYFSQSGQLEIAEILAGKKNPVQTKGIRALLKADYFHAITRFT
jgi:hypothetical protein